MSSASFGQLATLIPRANVLLVDDNPANLLTLEATLETLQVDLVRAQSGNEALRLLAAQDFAVILLDVHMHGQDGLETARQIRSRPRSQYSPIIFLTAYESDQSRVAAAYELGAVDYLVKPLAPEILRAKVAALVDLFNEKERARHHGEQFRLLVQATVDYAIFMLDPQGRVITWNAGAERIKGYRSEEIIGQHFSRFYPQEAVDRGWPNEELRRAETDGRFEDEGWRLRKNGSRFWANVVITALRNKAGVLQGFSKVTRDLTERKRGEEVLRQALGELETKVALRTRELSAANAELTESARRKDQFVAMLAHELRNPLAPVLNGLHILRLAEDDQDVIRQARTMIERQVHHLKRLVDDLLDVSRIICGKIQIKRECLDLTNVVRIAAEDRRSVIEQAGMTFVVDVPQSQMWVIGDSARLTQVLNNLLDNAMKFRNGGGCVTVRLSSDPRRAEAIVQVEDKGIGIEPDLFPRLFEVFGQADTSLDRSRGGLGVGLSVVKGLVELHGGDIAVASGGRGQGATFTIRLLLKLEASALNTTHQWLVARATESTRVLIIEDHGDAAESLRVLLELLGHQVVVANDGLEGVKMARAWHPDVVLCDVGLPELDGYGVAGELRSDPITAKTQLIAVTGYGEEADRQRSRLAGFDHHLTKPVDPTLLQSMLVRTA